jgi:hypothetical protein
VIHYDEHGCIWLKLAPTKKAGSAGKAASRRKSRVARNCGKPQVR